MVIRGLAVALSAVLMTGAAAGPAHVQPPGIRQPAHEGFTVSGPHIMKDGKPWMPLGFSIYTFGNGTMTFARDEYAQVTAQLRAIAGAWHGNTVRLQIGQYAYLHGSDGQAAGVYRAKVTAAVRYAESLGLAVVLNCTTEATGGLSTRDEPGPTSDTLSFWQAMRAYGRDPDVILDLFNEPRYPAGPLGDWELLFHGGGGYLGENQLIAAVRAMGFRNQLWTEATGNMALTELGVTWPRYRVTDPLNDVVYSYHHVSVDENAVPSVTEWNVAFGNLVTVRGVAVADGEWTNRSNPPGTGGTVYEPSGDQGQCWGDGPQSVPRYLTYLGGRGIGLIIWALGPGPAFQSFDMINRDGDNGPYESANNYDHWQGCQTPVGGHTSGAGQDIKDWFAAMNPAG